MIDTDNLLAYEQAALQELIAHLERLQTTPDAELDKRSMVAKRYAVAQHLKLIEKLLESGMGTSEILDLMTDRLQLLAINAQVLFRAKMAEQADRDRAERPTTGNDDRQSRVSANGQMHHLSVWAVRMANRIVAARVNAIPLPVRVAAGAAELMGFDQRWLGRVRHRSCVVGQPILSQVFVFGYDFELHKAIMCRVSRAFGIGHLNELELDLWLGRHGFKAFAGPDQPDGAAARELGRAWWPEIRRLQGPSWNYPKVTPQLLGLGWDLRHRTNAIEWCRASPGSGETVGPLLGAMVYSDEPFQPHNRLIPGDTIRADPGDTRWRVTSIEGLRVGKRIGWFCRLEPLPRKSARLLPH